MTAYWRSLACQAWAHASGGAGGLRARSISTSPSGIPSPLSFFFSPAPSRPRGGTGLSPWTAAPAGSRGPASRRRARRPATWSCPGPNAAWWSAETATMTRRRWWSWPNRRGGRCSPSRRPGPGTGLMWCPRTSTCSRRRNSGGVPARRAVSAGRPGLSRSQSALLAAPSAGTWSSAGARTLGGPTAGRHRRRRQTPAHRHASRDDALAGGVAPGRGRGPPRGGRHPRRAGSADRAQAGPGPGPSPSAGRTTVGGKQPARSGSRFSGHPPRRRPHPGQPGRERHRRYLSAAIGAALAHGGPALALVGDLAFLHDAPGLSVGPPKPRPDPRRSR